MGLYSEGVDLINLTHDKIKWRVDMNTGMDIRIQYKANNFLTTWLATDFSRKILFH
jgi:hypothetical protein